MKILIVDDQDIKVDLLSLICKEHFEFCEIIACSTYEASIKHINIMYDLILCDRVLLDKYADDFIVEYHKKYPNITIIYYSAEPDRVKNIGEIRCISFDSVEGRIRSINNIRKIEDMQQYADIYNKDLCDEKHKVLDNKNKDLHTDIKDIRGMLNGFFVVGVGTLFSTVSILIVELIKLKR